MGCIQDLYVRRVYYSQLVSSIHQLEILPDGPRTWRQRPTFDSATKRTLHDCHRPIPHPEPDSFCPFNSTAVLFIY
jgi:hypothetical protein